MVWSYEMSNLLVSRRQLLKGLGLAGTSIVVPGNLTPRCLSQIIEPAAVSNETFVLGTRLKMTDFYYDSNRQEAFSIASPENPIILTGPESVQMTFHSIGQVTPELLKWCKEQMC